MAPRTCRSIGCSSSAKPPSPPPRQQFRQSHDVADLLWQFLDEVDREHFVVILVDRKNRLIGIHTVSVGSLTASVVHPREVFKVAILSNAAAIICAHNHPSGAPRGA
jgi:DNA repair protein RadC